MRAHFIPRGCFFFSVLRLTVRETFQFAADNSTADVSQLGDADFTARQAKKVDCMLELLGLRECADTVVGNAVLRGVSGGQKKRVTLGEMMIGQARALFLESDTIRAHMAQRQIQVHVTISACRSRLHFVVLFSIVQ